MEGLETMELEELRTKIEKPYQTTVWGQPCEARPAFVMRGQHGDGKRLVALYPLMHRPHCFVVRADSTIKYDYETSQELLDLIEEEFGYCEDFEDEDEDEDSDRWPNCPDFSCGWEIGTFTPRN